MKNQQVSTPVAIGVIVLVVLVAAFFIWRGMAGPSAGGTTAGGPPVTDTRQQYTTPVPAPGPR